MKKNIQDYLHLYLGQEFIVHNATMSHIEGQNGDKHILDTYHLYNIACKKYEAKPLLRLATDFNKEDTWLMKELPDADGTKEEFENNYQEIIDIIKKEGFDAFEFDELKSITVFEFIIFLLNRGFDIYNLIEEGLALDKTKYYSDLINQKQ